MTMLEQTNQSKEVRFIIIERFDLDTNMFFTGIVKDSQGLKYEIRSDESVSLFEQALSVHNLRIVEDFQNKVLLFFPEDRIF